MSQSGNCNREFIYLGDRVSTSGGCEPVVTARTRCGWEMLTEYSKLLYGRFPLKLKGVVYKLCKAINTVWK